MGEIEQENSTPVGKRQRRRLWTYVVIMVAISVAAVVTISFLTMDRNTFKAMSHLELFSFVMVLALVLGRWLAEVFRYHLVIRSIGRRMQFRKTAKAVLGSAFTGSVTPFRSASFPTQVFFLSRYGLTGGEATAVSVSAGAISMLVMTIAMPVALIVGASKIHVSMGLRTVLVVIAVLLFFAFVVAVSSMRDPSRVSRMLERLAPRKLKAKPKFKHFEEKLTKGMGDFSESLRTLFKAPKATLLLIIALTVLFWLSGAFVASFILRGLGYPQFFWKAMLAQMLVSSILPFAPVPGESGVAEVAFAGVFSVFVQKNTIALVTMTWRFFMMYVPLVGLGIAFVLAANDARKLGREHELALELKPTPRPEPEPPLLIPDPTPEEAAL